jgi:hypothetical protein
MELHRWAKRILKKTGKKQDQNYHSIKAYNLEDHFNRPREGHAQRQGHAQAGKGNDLPYMCEDILR